MTEVGGRQARPWCEDYYDAVAHYYWDPGLLDHFSHSYLARHHKRSDPDGKGRPARVMQRLRRVEDPLNHILGLFFALAPSALISQLIQAASGEASEGPFRSLGTSSWSELGLGESTQPDVTLHAASSFTNFEVKVPGGHSDIQQVVKYGLVAMRARESYGVGRCRLIYLTPFGLPRIFKPSFTSWEAVRAAAVAMVPEIRKQAFTSLDDLGKATLITAIQQLGLASMTFAEFDDVLQAYLDAEARHEVESRLIGGLRTELRARNLVGG
jgi:hypothetical protein